MALGGPDRDTRPGERMVAARTAGAYSGQFRPILLPEVWPLSNVVLCLRRG